MRIWNEIKPNRLCRKHLLAEHREALCIWNVITQNKKGYSKQPESVRYRNNLSALLYRHNQLVNEATARGYNFKDLPNSLNIIPFNHNVKPWDNQEKSLAAKECDCLKHIKYEG